MEDRKKRRTKGQTKTIWVTHEHKFDSMSLMVGRMGCVGVYVHVGRVSGEIKEHPDWLCTRMFLISMVFAKGKKWKHLNAQGEIIPLLMICHATYVSGNMCCQPYKENAYIIMVKIQGSKLQYDFNYVKNALENVKYQEYLWLVRF